MLRRHDHYSAYHSLRSCLIGASLTGLLALAGCGDDDSSDTGTPTDQAGTEAGSGALYLIAATVLAGDQTETYLVTSPTFDESTKLDPTNGPKLLGGVSPVVHDGSAFVPDSNGPVLLRYNVDASDRLVKVGELSFAGVGVTTISSSHIYVVDKTKAYVFDPAGLRMIVWNPSTMTLTGKQIDLAAIAAEGYRPNVILEYMGARKRGDELIAPVSWQDQDGNSRFASGLVVINHVTDEFVSADFDTRCGESMTSIEAPNGDIYFLPPAWTSTIHYFTDMHQPTCAPRVAFGDTKFDKGEPWDLSALGSGSAAAGGIPDGENGFFFASIDRALSKVSGAFGTMTSRPSSHMK
jgi:hypothetical protein